VNDFLACAKVCEANGFRFQADLFRAFANDRCVVHVLLEVKEGFDVRLDTTEGGEPRCLFLDRIQAQHEALWLNIKAYREFDILEPCDYGEESELDLGAIGDLSADQLSESISKILGLEFRFPETADCPRPIFPPKATDQQMIQIMLLFSRLYFYVMETTLII